MAKKGIKTVVDGISFDSKSEAQFYILLKKAKKDGRIIDFEIEKEYVLLEEYMDLRGKVIPSMKHYPDYLLILNDGSKIVVDTKGASNITHETDAIIKRKIWMQQNPNIEYYYISKLSKYLGGVFVESSPYYDFCKKIENKHKKLYPNVNNRLDSSPKFKVKDWDKYFVYHDVAGLFYVMDKQFTKKELERRKKLKEKK